MKTGIYEADYGNAVYYEKGRDCGYDLDMLEVVPIEFIDFDNVISYDVDEYNIPASY